MIENKGGNVNFPAMIIATLTVGLFVTIIGSWIYLAGSTYDVTGNEYENFSSSFNRNQNMSKILDETYNVVDSVTVNPNWFDYLAGLFNSVLAPFKLIYNSIRIVIGLTSSFVASLNLLPVFADYFRAVLIAIVVVGLVMLRYYMNR